MSILIFIFVIFVAGLTAELLARQILHLQNHYYVWPPYYGMEMHLNLQFLPRLAPFVRFYVNSDGERGDELPRDRSHLYRILVAGGSPAECALLDQNDSWPMRLQSLLRAPAAMKGLGASRVHVGNIAKSGVDAEALDVIFEHGLRRFGRLDLIVIMVGGSSILNWLKSGAPPDPQYRRPTPDKFFGWQPHGPFGWSPKCTAVAEVMRRLRQIYKRPVLVRRGVGKSLNAARQMRLNALEMRTTTASPSGMLRNFEVAFRSALARAHGSANRVLVVRQPWFEKERFTAEEEAQFWNGSLGDPFSQNCTVFYSHGVLLDLARRIEEATVKICHETGTEDLDLKPVLESSVDNYYDHIHFTPAGSEIIAQAIAQFLMRSYPDGVDFKDEPHVVQGANAD